jgi:hypothetical protein
MYRDNTAKKIEDIQYQLALGKTRPEVAQALGYKDVTALYHFASRNKLKWNTKKKNYDAIGNDGKPIEAVKSVTDYPTGKVANIISMFERGMDGREIAKRLRFNSYQEMAEYMRLKGYVWNDSKGNYGIQPQVMEQGSKNISDYEDRNIRQKVDEEDSFKSTEYRDLFEMLLVNKDRLVELLSVSSSLSTLPRFQLVGRTNYKTIGIVDELDMIVKDFCEERHLSQKELFHIALIEFLKKYGYKNEVRARLKI